MNGRGRAQDEVREDLLLGEALVRVRVRVRGGFRVRVRVRGRVRV